MAIVCIIALVAFSIMGIFSAKYRAYAREALNCFFNTMRLRKCDSGLDERIKSEIVSKLMGVSVPAAKAVNSHFEILSSLFVIAMFASTFYSALGLYNFFVYGNCNGQEGGFCVFKDVSDTIAGRIYSVPAGTPGQNFGTANQNVIVYEYGCYSCPYTAQAEPDVQKLYSEFGNRVEFVYKTLPILAHPYSEYSAEASWCAYEQGNAQYTQMRSLLFSNQNEWHVSGEKGIDSLANSSGLNMTQYYSCISSGKYNATIAEITQESRQLGIAGTPTFFVGNKSISGSAFYPQLRQAIVDALGGQ
jgi:protein-disulfide isomerase